MKFGVPMIWREPLCHSVDCYFCLSKSTGFGKSAKWVYATVASVSLPVPHSSEFPHPKCPDSTIEFFESSQQTDTSSDNEFQQESQLQHFTQPDLNDLVRDLELSKEKAELLASRLKQRNCLAPGVNGTFYRIRDKPYAQHFKKENDICYCNDIPALFEQLGEPYDPNEWRLFIDGSKESLKAVLLHIGNEKPSIPIAHAINTKESYATMASLLKYIQYEHHNWKICSDLKVVGMLCGMQGGYTKYCCFLCLWDSRAREHHYRRKDWPERENVTVGKDNIKYVPLVKKENIILPALHIKLGLIKNFVKALDKEGQVFSYLKTLFPQLSLAKIKEGVFDGPHIKKLVKSTDFPKYLTPVENEAWNSFQRVVTNFLGNNKSPNYEGIITDLLKNYNKMGTECHYLISFLVVFYCIVFTILFISYRCKYVFKNPFLAFAFEFLSGQSW